MCYNYTLESIKKEVKMLEYRIAWSIEEVNRWASEGFTVFQFSAGIDEDIGGWSCFLMSRPVTA